MENNIEDQLNTLNGEYRKALSSLNLSKLKSFDMSEYAQIKFVVLSTNTQHYTSTNISSSGGGGRIYQGMTGTTGKISNVNISSNVEHHTKNEAWVANIENGSEIKVEFPADFDVREGHVIIVYGHYSGWNSEILIIERYLNLNTKQVSIESSGVFNNLTLITKESSCLLFFVCLLPCIGSAFSLFYLKCPYPKLLSGFKKYNNAFYSKATNWLISLIVLAIASYQFAQHPAFFTAPYAILLRQDIAVVILTATPIVILIMILTTRYLRNRKVVKFIRAHSTYLDKMITLQAIDTKHNSDIQIKANSIFSSINGNNKETAQIDTKECPECAETIKFNAKKCRFCNTILEAPANHNQNK